MNHPNRIRLRLTAWYAGSIAVVLLGATLTARTVLHNEAEGAFVRTQSTTMGLVRGFFRTEVLEYASVQATVAHISGELVLPERRIDFLAPDGSRFVPPRPAPEPVSFDPPIRTTTAPLDDALAPGWRIQVQLSAAELKRQEARIEIVSLLAVPCIMLVAAAIGWVITGRTLAPIRSMAETAERISPQSGERLPILDATDEIGRLGTRFNALLSRLDDALAQQRRFLADAAHELRSPLARMRADVEATLAAPTDALGERSALERSAADITRMATLVDELLQLARADADLREAVLERCYLDDVVAGAIGPWERSARAAGVTMRLLVEKEAPAHLDAALTERLLGVLADNAIRYTPSGGSVEVRVLATPEGARLEIEDSGIGIPDGERTNVFDRFYRGTRARTVAKDGSGLGLAIAQWVAQQHHAAIGLDRAPRGGTVAWVQFPVVSGTAGVAT